MIFKISGFTIFLLLVMSILAFGEAMRNKFIYKKINFTKSKIQKHIKLEAKNSTHSLKYES